MNIAIVFAGGKDSKSVEGNIKDTVYSSCVTYFHMYYL